MTLIKFRRWDDRGTIWINPETVVSVETRDADVLDECTIVCKSGGPYRVMGDAGSVMEKLGIGDEE